MCIALLACAAGLASAWTTDEPIPAEAVPFIGTPVPEQPKQVWPGELHAVYTPIFVGVDHAEIIMETPPLRQVVNVLRIDLDAPGLSFVATPHNGDTALETNGQTASSFLTQHGVQAAINTHFFSPCCANEPGQPKDLIGLAIANNQLVSPQTADCSQRDVLVLGPNLDEETTGWDALFAADLAEVRSLDADDLGEYLAWLKLVDIAVAGTMIRSCGQNIVKAQNEDPRHPRTAIGLDFSGRTLYFITVDGRRPMVSHGVTLAELAQLGEALDAWYVLNVDGGGSTTMVVQGDDGKPTILNSPSAGRERVNGSHLGVVAGRLPGENESRPDLEDHGTIHDPQNK